MSDSGLEGFPVLSPTDLQGIPSVNLEFMNSQVISVPIESQSMSIQAHLPEPINDSYSNSNSNSNSNSIDQHENINQEKNPMKNIIPPSTFDINNNLQTTENKNGIDKNINLSQPNELNHSSEIAQPTDIYSYIIQSPDGENTDQVDYRSLDHYETESCRKSCCKLLAGLFCNFEKTVYTYTRPLNQEMEKMNYQCHHRINKFFFNVCGCDERKLFDI